MRAIDRSISYPCWRLWKMLVLTLLVGSLQVCCRRDDSSTSPAEHVGSSNIWFEEIAQEAKIDFKHTPFIKQRFYMVENVSSGVGLFDYNGDGYLDIYFVQGGDYQTPASENLGNQLFENLGDGTFKDVTEVAGVGDTGYGMGCACGDFDNDGDVDLYVTNVGPNVLYRNNGDGTFTDVSAKAGVDDPSWSTSCAFVDYDQDGWLDIFSVNYLNWSPQRELTCKGTHGERDYCTPKDYQAPAPDTLYHNNGDGTFTDVSERVGLRKVFGNGLGIVCGDFNGDGNTDVYVANDQMANQLWMGDGSGRFTDQALLSGCALNAFGAAEASMGVMAIDVENDGDLDIFLSHLHTESNTFYRNDDGLFNDVTARLGLALPSLPYTGFGLGFADFDHDGHLEVLIVNGRVNKRPSAFGSDDPYVEPNILFRGGSGGRFVANIPNAGLIKPLIKNSRGAAFGDIDNDGDIDVVIANLGGPAHILRNVIGAQSGGWVMFRVLNRKGVDAIGASVRVTSAGRQQWRSVQTVYSYCASNDPRVHFGLGDETTIDKVLVRWPLGREEEFGPFQAGRHYDLKEGQGREH